ncbi:MAG: DUF2784 domain-containing protein [Nitrospirae bacterium]|nr:DUF2784 domain-containing protein [Nitrospirota bacterium]
MNYKAMADATALAHFLFVLFVIFGGLIVFKWRGAAWLHLPAALWGALIEFFGWICPLTHLENFFREKAGAVTMERGFVAHYILPLLYPAELTKGLQIKLGLFVIFLNIIIYGFVICRHRTKK